MAPGGYNTHAARGVVSAYNFTFAETHAAWGVGLYLQSHICWDPKRNVDSTTDTRPLELES